MRDLRSITLNYLPTGSMTLLTSFETISRKGSWTWVPKNRRISAGVRSIPAMLLMTALQRAEATLPPADDVRITHILTVVGRQVRISNPSNRGAGRMVGKNFFIAWVKGSPTKNGQTANVTNCMDVLSLMFENAPFNSDTSRDSPESKKIKVTPNFPINSSGFNMPPFVPSYFSFVE